MKLLKVIIVSFSFFVFSITAFAGSNKPTETDGTLNENQMPMPNFLPDDSQYSMTTFLWRATQYMKFSLNKEEKKMHQSAVFYMLENPPNGKIVSWYSDKRLANGKVRVIHSYPISGGYCRQYQAYIKVNGKERHITNNACKRITGVSWSCYK